MRELKLSNVKVAGQSSGETNFNKVSLLLPFDGSDTATSTSDESDNSHTITFAGTAQLDTCLLYTSPSPRDGLLSRMPSSA